MYPETTFKFAKRMRLIISHAHWYWTFVAVVGSDSRFCVFCVILIRIIRSMKGIRFRISFEGYKRCGMISHNKVGRRCVTVRWKIVKLKNSNFKCLACAPGSWSQLNSKRSRWVLTNQISWKYNIYWLGDRRKFCGRDQVEAFTLTLLVAFHIYF